MQKKKGISLIVLVITIIVMIILAAAIIISLNNTGIISNANKAVSATDLKNVQYAATLVYQDMLLGNYENPSKILKQGEYIKQKLVSQNVITNDQAQNYIFKNNGDVLKIQTKEEYENMYKDETLKSDVIVIPYGTVEYRGVDNNKSITKVIMPDTLKKLEGFMYCTNISEVVPSNNLEEVGLNVFIDSKWLTETKNNNDGMAIIGKVLIDGSGAKENVVIPNTVERIGYAAFDGENHIISVTIPNTVDTIYASGFGACSNLANVKFEGAIPKIGQAAFGGTNLPESLKDKILKENPTAFDSPDL